LLKKALLYFRVRRFFKIALLTLYQERVTLGLLFRLSLYKAAMDGYTEVQIPEKIEGEALATFGCGKCVQLNFLCLEPGQALRLREMGLCEGKQVCVLHNTDKVIVRSGGSRIGLHRDLAHQIYGTEVGKDQAVLSGIRSLFVHLSARFVHFFRSSSRRQVGEELTVVDSSVPGGLPG
jgi:Fe2+ transport system protein FeoA